MIARQNPSPNTIRAAVRAVAGRPEAPPFVPPGAGGESVAAKARATWSALSPAQRRVLLFLAPGRALVRCGWTPHFYDAVCATGAWPGLSTIAKAARLDTVRNLVSRGLLDLDGTATDPERRAVLSDRGRFVVAHRGEGRDAA